MKDTAEKSVFPGVPIVYIRQLPGAEAPGRCPTSKPWNAKSNKNLGYLFKLNFDNNY